MVLSPPVTLEYPDELMASGLLLSPSRLLLSSLLLLLLGSHSRPFWQRMRRAFDERKEVGRRRGTPSNDPEMGSDGG
jgi:hypothetical protein